MGCVYRRKDSKYLWIKYSKHGRVYSESSGSPLKVVAEQLLRRREGEIAHGKLPGVCFERVKFDELVGDYLTDYRINKKKSVEKAERCVRYLRDAFGGMKVPEITTPVIKKYIEKRLDEGKSNATVNRELAALKRIFNLAARSTPPRVAYVPYIPMLKENNIRKGFFEHEQYQSLMRTLPEHLRPVVTFAYLTGWRKQEILSLKWDHVDLQEGIVRLEPGETKNDEGRTLYLEPQLYKLLKGLQSKRAFGCSYVFLKDGKGMNDLRKSWDAACKKAGIPGMLFHDLRRTAVRNMVRAGIPERVAMAVSGHKTRAVFDRYNIVSKEDLKEAALKRQKFVEMQGSQLRFGYVRPKTSAKERGRKSHLRLVTP